jgi:hypothetical protein
LLICAELEASPKYLLKTERQRERREEKKKKIIFFFIQTEAAIDK